MVLEIWSMTKRIFHSLEHFLYFYHSNNLENQNFEKMKKIYKKMCLEIFTQGYHNPHEKINQCLTDINQCLIDIFKI